MSVKDQATELQKRLVTPKVDEWMRRYSDMFLEYDRAAEHLVTGQEASAIMMQCAGVEKFDREELMVVAMLIGMSVEANNHMHRAAHMARELVGSVLGNTEGSDENVSGSN